VVCMPKSHPLVERPSIGPRDLNGVPMIAISRESLPMQHMEIEEYFDEFGVRLNVVADAFGPPEALSMVEHNMGVSLLSASAAQGPSIVAKPLSVKTLTRKSGLYVREDNRHPVVSEFVNLVFAKTTAGHLENRHHSSIRHGRPAAKSSHVSP